MMLTRRDLIVGTSAVGLTGMLPWRAQAATTALSGRAFGSTWHMVVAADVDPMVAREAVEANVDDIDRSMSPYDPDSFLSRFNASQATDWRGADADLLRCARAAVELARQTDGAFDPTVGPLVNRHGFGPIRGRKSHWSALAIQPMGIRKADPHLTLDLCGIAKGRALDRIIGHLPRVGIGRSLVELGGEVMALGRHPDGRDWQVAIEDPLADDFAAHRIVALRGKALATSGHRVNGLAGRTSHIIDPSSGRPATGAIASVSVLSAEAMMADAMATALCAMGAERGIAFAQDRAVDALFVLADGPGKRDVMTGQVADHVIA